MITFDEALHKVILVLPNSVTAAEQANARDEATQQAQKFLDFVDEFQSHKLYTPIIAMVAAMENDDGFETAVVNCFMLGLRVGVEMERQSI